MPAKALEISQVEAGREVKFNHKLIKIDKVKFKNTRKERRKSDGKI